MAVSDSFAVDRDLMLDRLLFEEAVLVLHLGGGAGAVAGEALGEMTAQFRPGGIAQVEKRQGHLAERQVGAERFAQKILVADQVLRVIQDLERQTEAGSEDS